LRPIIRNRLQGAAGFSITFWSTASAASNTWAWAERAGPRLLQRSRLSCPLRPCTARLPAREGRPPRKLGVLFLRAASGSTIPPRHRPSVAIVTTTPPAPARPPTTWTNYALSKTPQAPWGRTGQLSGPGVSRHFDSAGGRDLPRRAGQPARLAKAGGKGDLFRKPRPSWSWTRTSLRLPTRRHKLGYLEPAPNHSQVLAALPAQTFAKPIRHHVAQV